MTTKFNQILIGAFAGVAMLFLGGSELLTNGSFETGDLTGWTNPGSGGGAATVGAPVVGAHDGSTTAVLLTQGAGVGEIRQTFPATAGTTYNFSGYMLTEAAITDSDSFGVLKIVFRDADGNDLTPTVANEGQINTDFPGIEALPFLNGSSTVNSWEFSEAEGVAPAGTTQVLFLALNVDFGSEVNPIWFDSLDANDVADGTNLLTNGDFETEDLTGWVDPGGSGSATLGEPANVAAQDGSVAALITLGAGVGELNQTFPAAPGDEFNFSGYMLTETAITDADSFGVLKIVFRDADGNDLAPESVSIGQANEAFPGVEALPFVNGDSDAEEWVFTEAQGVAPDGTVEVLFLALNVDFGSETNPIWFDNIKAMPVGGVITVTPDSVTRTAGTFVAGDIAELAASDNSDYQLRRSSTDISARTEFVVKGVSSNESPSSFEFTFEGSVFARTNVVQTIEFFDYDANDWELVDTRNAARFSDSTATVAGTGDLSRFVEDGTGCIEARIHYQSDNPRQSYASNSDQAIWVIE